MVRIIMYLIPLLERNSSNSAPLRRRPLSVTTVLGSPNCANSGLNSSTMMAEVCCSECKLHLSIWNGHLSFCRTRIIEVQTIPRPGWPTPWVQRCNCWSRLVHLTSRTQLDGMLYILHKSRPPDIHPSKSLHSGDARMTFM